MAAVQALKEKIEAGKEELEKVEAELDRLVVSLPNLPDPDAPDGLSRGGRGGPARGRRQARVRLRAARPPRHRHRAGPDRHGGRRRDSPARASPTSRATWCCWSWRWSASRSSWSAAEGHEPVVPPVLVREEALEGTGFLPGDRDQIYEIPKDELFLTGTSEVALAGLHAGEILDPGALPLRYCGFSTCFRREAGAAGRDTRGIFRVHQFDKVEMFSFVEPSRVGGRARAHARDRGAHPRASWRSPTGWSTSPSATSAPRPPRSTTARPGSPARGATAS